MQNKLNIIRSMQEIIAETLGQASDEKVLTLKGEDPLKISRDDAEVLGKFIEKYSKLENKEDLYNAVKEDYDEIPYIVGSHEESVIWKFQMMLESIIG